MSSSASLSKALLRRPSAIFLNSARLNYDKKLDYTRLSSLTQLHIHHVDSVTSTKDIISLLQTHKPEIVITKEMEVPSSILTDSNFPSSVKLLCEAGTGYNNLPIKQATERQPKIHVCNIPTYSNESVAHMVITYIMNFSSAMFDQARMIYRDNNKANFHVFQHPIYEITDKTLGLIGGSGTIGTNVMDVAIPLGMKILISSRNKELPSHHKYYNHPKVKVVASKEELLSQSDFVSINCPLNEQTRHSIGRDEIKLMKPTAFLINTARGAIINEQELIGCMKENMIAGAGLDTQEVEPPSDESELWTLDNVFMTPHIGWRRLETRQRLVDMTADNIEAYIKDEMINVVN